MISLPPIISVSSTTRVDVARDHPSHGSATISFLDENNKELMAVIVSLKRLDTATALILSQLEERKEEAA